MKLQRIGTVCLLGLMAIFGCGDDGKTNVTKERLEEMSGGELKEVVPVKGSVSIDGTPAVGVNLFLYREGSTVIAIKECRTNEKGEYCWSSYETCDGLEPGSYLLGFTHIPKPKKDDSGEDLLKGKYKDAGMNKIELRVEKGMPQEKADYNLVTK